MGKDKAGVIADLTIDTPATGDPIISPFYVEGSGSLTDYVWIYVINGKAPPEPPIFSSTTGTAIDANGEYSVEVAVDCSKLHDPHVIRAYVTNSSINGPGANDPYIEVTNLAITCVAADVETPIIITLP